MTSSVAISAKKTGLRAKKQSFREAVLIFLTTANIFTRLMLFFLRIDHCNNDLKIKETP